MKKAENTASFGYIIGIPLFLGCVLTVVLFLCGALLVQSERLPSEDIPVWTVCVLGVCGFLQALLAAGRALRSKFLWGVVAGTLFLLLLLVGSVLWFGQPIDLGRVFTVSATTLGATFTGSLVGASRLKRKRK